MGDFFIPLIIGVVGVCLGFVFGSVKFFREEKQRVYRETLPIIIRAYYRRAEVKVEREAREKEFNEAIDKLWLYGNRDVTSRADEISKLLARSTPKEKVGEAYQELIAAMRKDIQVFTKQRIPPEHILHFYMDFGSST